MSYSRWTHSIWYTYWCMSSCNTPSLMTRLNQRFTVQSCGTFSYLELTKDIENCLDKCGAYDKTERVELKGYMLEFIKDVDADLPLKDTFS